MVTTIACFVRLVLVSTIYVIKNVLNIFPGYCFRFNLGGMEIRENTNKP